MKKLDIYVPADLDETIEEYVKAVNRGGLIDCETSQLMGDINMAESIQMITSETAWKLRKYYLGGIYGSDI